MPPEDGAARPLLNALPQRLPELRSDRLLLRAMVSGDAPALFRIYGDPEVMRHASDGVFAHPAMVGTMLQSVARLLASGESLEWAVVERASAELIGTCGLHGFDREAASAEVGILLARPAWGRGCAAEALTALIGWGRSALGVRLLRADIDPANTRSAALFERLGFVRRPGSLHELAFGADDAEEPS